MDLVYRDYGAILRLFAVLLLLSAAALIAALAKGRQWGDLSSRRSSGEALSQEDTLRLRKSRRSFLIWSAVSLAAAGLAFYTLR